MIEFCAEENIKFIEIAFLWGKSVLDLDEGEINRVKEILDRNGVKVASIQTQIMKVHPSITSVSRIGSKDMHRDEAYNLSKIDSAIKMANEFGTKYIITYSYFNRYIEAGEDIWPRLIVNYEPLVDACEESNKTMVLECEGDTVVGSIDDYFNLFDFFESPHLKVNLDLANLVGHVGKFDRDDFDRIKEHVEYFHVKDRKRVTRGFFKKRVVETGAVFGEGYIPWKDALTWFNEYGYEGFLSVEPHVHGKNKFEMAKNCVKNLKNLLGELNINFT
ncbi:MAG: sugar phosphate isomerase/epimerase family protein [Promethearchaeota archaeon]